MNNEKRAIFITIVAGRKQKDDILAALNDMDVNLVNVIYGKGAAKSGFLMNMLGLISEENKVVLSCVTTYLKSNSILDLLVERFDFDKPNTGMAFTVPIESVSF